MTVFKKKYTISQQDFKSKFLRKTIRPDILSKLQTNFEKNDSKRVFFGKLENCHFTLYSVPDISGPWNSKIWLSPWRGMAMWVSPVHIYGTVYGTLEETKIDFTIAKRKRDIFIYNFVIITDIILFIINSTFPPIKLVQMLELSSKKCNKLLY